MVNTWLNNIHSRLFPVDCLYCGGTVHGQLALCDLCQQKLPHNHSRCKRCAEPLPGMSQGMCGKCLKKLPQFDRVVSPFLYQPPISTLVTRFKYHADLAAGQILAQLLASYLRDRLFHAPPALRPGCIIPVPLHPSRLRQRGFNQSLELSRQLAKQLAIPVIPDLCFRHQKTDSQSGLDEKQRRRNVRNAFSTAASLPSQHVAIVDDVMTTGNTVNELAKVLRKAGAQTIQVWCVCRASDWRLKI